MARDEKRLTLRPVDDEPVDATPVIRLQNQETEVREREAKPVRLGAPAGDEPAVSRRLDLPNRDEVELRTHQPGIDVLIEPEMSPQELVEENWGEATLRKNPVPWGWFVLIGLAIAGAVIWSITRVEKAEVRADLIRSETKSVLVDDEKEEREAGELISRLEKALSRFFAATTVEELEPLVRQPERVVPLMRSYYQSPTSSSRLKSVKLLQPLTLENRGNFWMASVILMDSTTRSLIIEVDEQDGKPRVDWETLVCYQPMKWDEFVSKRPTGISLDFRVHAERDNFYSHEFSDSDQWTSFRLTALDSEETLFGYVPAQGEQAAVLTNLIEMNPNRRVTVILRVSIPEDLRSRRGAVIEKVVNSRWIYLDPPESGS